MQGVSVSSYAGDSGDIILASWFAGVAHPPGYPLNTMLGWVFTHLPFSASIAFKANLMAAFFQAGTAAFIFLISQILTKRTLLSIVAAFIFAFNPLFWLYAHIIEVFQLNLFLVSISVYFLFRWGARVKNLKGKGVTKNLLLSIFFLGLAVFHHQTSLLLTPAYFYYIFATNKKIFNLKSILLLGAVFLLGFLPYIFIPIAAQRATPVNWGDPSNLPNFLRLITRADYGTFQASNFIIGDTLSRRLIQLANYFLFVKADFNLLGLGLFVFGCVYAFLQKRKYFFFLLIAIFFTGPFFFFYGSFPILNDFYVGLWERFLLLSYLFLVIFLALGLSFIVEKLEPFLIRTNLKPLKASGKLFLVNSIFLLVPFGLFFLNLSKTDLSEFNLGDWLAYDTLASAEEGSIIFLVGDTSVFNTQYVYYTDPRVQKYKIIRMGSLNRLEYREQLAREYGDLHFPGNFLDKNNIESLPYIISIIEDNRDEVPIYSADFIPNIEAYYWMQSGLLKKLVKKDDVNREMLIDNNRRSFDNFRYKDYKTKSYTHYLETHIKEVYYDAFNAAARELYSNKEEELSINYLNNAIDILPERKDAYINLASIYYQKNMCDMAKDLLFKAKKIDVKDFNIALALSDIYKNCYKDLEKANFYKEESDSIRTKFHEDKI